ncbi:hypothetical protein [Haloprofundus halophilus]|uniref:hypothetical protein n=1 Tax=Haloprofundus halophilus TaxID=2283527 RepID=UPI000E44A970|nr:hypothetical protein [Haloprofundus halophilus]
MADGARPATGESGYRRIADWLLLEGNRLSIAGGVLLLTLGGFLAVLLPFGPSSVRPGSPMYFLYSSLLTGDLTLLTVVLSINQLVLSRELGEPGTLRKRINETLSYRHDVEELVGASTSPKSPSGFLHLLHRSLEAQAGELAALTDRVDDAQARRRLRSLSDSLERDAQAVSRTLDGEDGSIFSVMSATVSTTHADQLQTIAGLQSGDADPVTDELLRHLDRIEATLLQIDVARKYFRTVYVQKELAYLSRILLYIGVPAIVGSGLALVLYNANTVAAVPSTLFVGAVTVTFVLGFAPLAVLFAFVLRLAWVAQQTATVPPYDTESSYRL